MPPNTRTLFLLIFVARNGEVASDSSEEKMELNSGYWMRVDKCNGLSRRSNMFMIHRPNLKLQLQMFYQMVWINIGWLNHFSNTSKKKKKKPIKFQKKIDRKNSICIDFVGLQQLLLKHNCLFFLIELYI